MKMTDEIGLFFVMELSRLQFLKLNKVCYYLEMTDINLS